MVDGASVVFGTGAVGSAVVRELLAQGREVRAVNRSGHADLPAEVPLLAGDAADPEFAARAAAGADTVYFCVNPPYHLWPQLFPPLQAAVVEGAAAAGAKVVSMENVYMYGPTGGRPLTEDLPYTATTRKGRVRAAMATDLLAAHREGKVRATIGRASDFYGPGALLSAAGERVFASAVAGKAAQVVGNPELPHTYSYVPDIAKGLVTLADSEKADGSAWHLPSAETVSTSQFVARIGQALGKELKLSVAPAPLLRVLGLFQPTVRELAEMMYEFDEPFVVDHSRYAATFVDHSTPLDDAIAATLDWYRRRAG